jgi:hypothetical protein
MAQHSAWTAGEDRGHPVRSFINAEMADGIDALVEAVQSPTTHTLGDRRGRQPSREELLRRDDPVLRARDGSQAKIDRGGFANHRDVKPPRPADSPPLRAEYRL